MFRPEGPSPSFILKYKEISVLIVSNKGKGHPITGHETPQRE
jgi:hypothetical protein